MFILLSSEKSDPAEKEQLTHLFESGLQLLHVRKPGITEKELKAWLFQFEDKQLQKMILHQHHALAKAFPVKGIHLKENFRRERERLPAYVEQFKSNDLSVSSSFHDPEMVKNGASIFDYVFLSPVFSSISKSACERKEFNVEALSQKVIALGGIETETISKAKELGFSGVAVLGAVWLAENKQQRFVEIYNEYSDVYR